MGTRRPNRALDTDVRNLARLARILPLCRPFADRSLGRFPATAVSPERYFHFAFYDFKTKGASPRCPIAVSSLEKRFSRACSLVDANSPSSVSRVYPPRPPACILSWES